MSFSFRPATRENIGLLIGLVGASGSGKTKSAMRLAQGIVGRAGKFAVIDTESERARHYAPLPGTEPDFVDTYRFDHASLEPPFRPDRYREVIEAAVKASYPVIVVDSMSHEHAGEGGLLDWHDEILDKMAGNDWKKREACTMVAWVEPKMAHKRMMQRLIALPSHVHLILCFRSEEKIEIVREDGKTKIVPKRSSTGLDGWIPICEKNTPYELTASLLLTADKPGYPKPIKLQGQHRPLFPLDKPIDEESGRRLAEWAKGGVKPATVPPAAAPPKPAAAPTPQPAQPPLSAPSADTDDGQAFLGETEEPSPIDGGGKDEATTGGLISQIHAEVAKWPRKPPETMQRAIFAHFLEGKTDLTTATPGELTVMLAFFRDYTAKKPEATKRINDAARTARATA